MSQIRPFRGPAFDVRTRIRSLRRSDYRLVRLVRRRSQELKNFSEDQLAECCGHVRSTSKSRSSSLTRKHVVESFALTVEALRRVSGKTHYDVQLLAGIVLATGAIAEMQTGEGKTIVCSLPAVLHAWSGRGVHVATTNEYLAGRDHQELKPVFEMLGLSCGFIHSEMELSEKQAAYSCDITYGTGYEFGFDFLRDQLALRNKPTLRLGTRFVGRLRGNSTRELQLTQRKLNFAIIDEADSVMIDEATTPLILSGSTRTKQPKRAVYQHARMVADQLVEEVDYSIGTVRKSIELTDQCWRRIHQDLPTHVQEQLDRMWGQYVEQSLRARIFLKRDVDYVLQTEQIVFVDKNTGRLHEDRKWQDGLQQSIETREGAPLSDEREIEARITRQRYYKFYQQTCGMTGTAAGNEVELMEFYGLPVVCIPRNQSSQMAVGKARAFVDQATKFRAIVQEIECRQRNRQPVLVGIRTIAQSRKISLMLNQRKIAHRILNGVQDASEASVIASAGLAGSVTLATNMAGRGTDIRLDSEAVNAGGLHVIVVEHHDSVRVDRQLIGRAARQSDPGSCQFFVAADDCILKTYAPKMGQRIRQHSNVQGECRRDLTRQFDELQKRIEQLNFVERRNMVVHDSWLETAQQSVAKTA